MLKKLTFGFIILFLFSACPIFDPEFPYKDDPTTVGNFKSSKFDGFWEVQDFSQSLSYQTIYIFRENTFQSFRVMKDSNTSDKFSEYNRGELPKEFLYSDTVIYTEEFYNYYEWKKTPYELSSDGNNLTFGREKLKKIKIEPWTKEDILGSWYKVEYNGSLTIFTFKENSLVIQSLRNGKPYGEDNYLEITLTDEYFEQKNSTCFYFLYDNRLLFLTHVLQRYTEIIVNSLKDAEEKLTAYPFSWNNLNFPMVMYVNFYLGDLSQPDNDYLRLLEIIGNSGLYVELELGGAKMSGTTVFTSPPLYDAVKGMDKIVRIELPYMISSIKADINGRSPFFSYKNLINFETGIHITKIDDYAFSSCKSFKNIKISWCETVGREAFRDCENLENINLGQVEEIMDNAFLNCDSLESLTMHSLPPILGDSVFLGSTPGTFTIFIGMGYEELYHTWLIDNASKFNNKGENIVIKFR